MIAFGPHSTGALFCTDHTRTGHCYGCDEDKKTVRCIFINREMYTDGPLAHRDRLPLCRECYRKYREIVQLAKAVGA